MMHKAEVKEVAGITWFSKACFSDRLAIGIFNSTLQAGRRKRVYMYHGGGVMGEAQASSGGGG
eukprot:4815579-Prorocentrum_lima.AAC.1